MCLYPATEIHTFSMVAWFKMYLSVDHYTDNSLPRVTLATQAYVKHHRCEKPFYVSTGVDFSQPSQECSLVCLSFLPRAFQSSQKRLENNHCSAVLVNSSKYTLDGILRSGKCLRYSSTKARELPLQKPYTKCMSLYSTWENTKGILAIQYTTKHSLRNHSEYWTPWRKRISLDRHQHAAPRADLRVDKNRSWQLSFLDPKEVHIFNCQYLPNRSTLDMGVLGFFGIV